MSSSRLLFFRAEWLVANVREWAVVGVRCASRSPFQKRILKDTTFTLNQNPPLHMHYVGGWLFYFAISKYSLTSSVVKSTVDIICGSLVRLKNIKFQPGIFFFLMSKSHVLFFPLSRKYCANVDICGVDLLTRQDRLSCPTRTLFLIYQKSPLIYQIFRHRILQLPCSLVQ